MSNYATTGSEQQQRMASILQGYLPIHASDQRLPSVNHPSLGPTPQLSLGPSQAQNGQVGLPSKSNAPCTVTLPSKLSLPKPIHADPYSPSLVQSQSSSMQQMRASLLVHSFTTAQLIYDIHVQMT